MRLSFSQDVLTWLTKPLDNLEESRKDNRGIHFIMYMTENTLAMIHTTINESNHPSPTPPQVLQESP